MGLSKLSTSELRTLISGLESGRITVPVSSIQLSKVLSNSFLQPVLSDLESLQNKGFDGPQIAAAIQLVFEARIETENAKDIDLVTSGPEGPGSTNRETSAVVRELFSSAQQSVYVIGYAIYQGQKVFEYLCNRMKENPDLAVKFFLEIHRPDNNTTPSNILVSQFATRFKTKQWPDDCRLPEIFYDPRSVSDNLPIRSSMHAKCLVIDERLVFVSSANFTEAAQERNIEVGLTIENKRIAAKIIKHFEKLNEARLMQRLL